MVLPEAPVVAPETRSNQMVDRRGFGDGVQYPAVLGECIDMEFVAACNAVEVDGRDDIPGKVRVAVQPVGAPLQPDLLAGEGDEVDRSVQGFRPERPCDLKHHGDPGGVVVRSGAVGTVDIVVGADDDDPRPGALLDTDDVLGRGRSRIRLDGKDLLLYVISVLLQSPGDVVGSRSVVEAGDPLVVGEHPDDLG